MAQQLLSASRWSSAHQRTNVYLKTRLSSASSRSSEIAQRFSAKSFPSNASTTGDAEETKESAQVRECAHPIIHSAPITHVFKEQTSSVSAACFKTAQGLCLMVRSSNSLDVPMGLAVAPTKTVHLRSAA